MPKQFFFGAGTLYGLDNSTPTPTPVKFGTLQDVSVEFSADVKELYGANQFPAHIGRGKNKITCKAKLGQIQGAMLNVLYFGLPKNEGELLLGPGRGGPDPGRRALHDHSWPTAPVRPRPGGGLRRHRHPLDPGAPAPTARWGNTASARPRGSTPSPRPTKARPSSSTTSITRPPPGEPSPSATSRWAWRPPSRRS